MDKQALIEETLQKTTRDCVVASILEERGRQNAKFGLQEHTPMTWAAILGEEFGEFCEAGLKFMFEGATEEKLEHMKTEALHVAAVAVQVLECLERGTWMQKYKFVCEEHKWEGVWLTDELEGYRCKVCGTERYELEENSL